LPVRAFDPFPYILLNLFLSMMAGVQAAALLIAAKRSDAVASEIAIHTEHNTDDIKDLIAQNLQLIRDVKRQTDLLDEIHRHLTTLTPDAGQFPPTTGTSSTATSPTGPAHSGTLPQE